MPLFIIRFLLNHVFDTTKNAHLILYKKKLLFLLINLLVKWSLELNLIKGCV